MSIIVKKQVFLPKKQVVSKEKCINQTKKWIEEVVVGCNFCPFAAKELRMNTIHYQVVEDEDLELVLARLVKECIRLDENKKIATSLLIFSGGFQDFQTYLQLVDLSEQLMNQEGYDGIYQLASFHPQYLFAGTDEKDPSNYSNRSVYPMLHLLREDSVTQAVETHPDVDGIPQRNIDFANEKGLAFMQQLLDSCIKSA